jgi:hypothetical protein
MVPPTDSTSESHPDRSPHPDGGESPPGPGFDEAALHAVVRDAVEDAILGVIGTVLLVGVAAVLVVAGVQIATLTPSPAGAVVGVAVAVGGLYLAAATLGVVPPVRDWF